MLYLATVVEPSPPPAPAYVEPPPVPDASFFWWDEGEFGRHFYITYKVVTVKSVRLNYGDGSDSGKLLSPDGTSSARALNPLHAYSTAGDYTVILTMEAKLDGRDTTFVSSQVVPVGPPLEPAAVVSPDPGPRHYKTGLIGSRMVKATTKAGGGKKKRPAGKVTAIENRSWGEIKAEMSQER